MIDPYSNAEHHALGGKWYPNETNYPACAAGNGFLFHENDISTGATQWVSRCGGLTMPILTATKDADGVYAIPTGGNLLAGTLPVVGDKYPYVFWQGKIASAVQSILIGDIVNAGIFFVAGTTGYMAASATDFVTFAAPSPAVTFPLTGCIAAAGETDAATLAGGDVWITATSSGVRSVSTRGALTGGGIAGTWPAFTSNRVDMPNGAANRTRMFGLMLFTVKPSKSLLQSATFWMAANPGKLYPGLAGMV